VRTNQIEDDTGAAALVDMVNKRTITRTDAGV